MQVVGAGIEGVALGQAVKAQGAQHHRLEPPGPQHGGGRTVPIIVDGVTSMEHYVNPIPAGLVLTGIVVSVSVSAVMLSLTVRIYQTYRTLDMDKLYMMMSHKKRQKEDGEQ